MEKTEIITRENGKVTAFFKALDRILDNVEALTATLSDGSGSFPKTAYQPEDFTGIPHHRENSLYPVRRKSPVQGIGY